MNETFFHGPETGFQAKITKTREALCSDVYNKANLDGVSPHQFPADESVRRQRMAFVLTKRESKSWTPGSGHICSDHFSADNYEGFRTKIAGF